MKKALYLLMFIGIVSISCEPLEETYTELDALFVPTPNIDDELEYTITEEDYTELELATANFSSLDQAKDLIPSVLDNRFPELDNGSLADVSFMLKDSIVPVQYTVSDADYQDWIASDDDANGPYFTGTSDANSFLKFKFPQASVGTFYELTYKAISEQIAYTLTDDDYALVGNGNFNNFDIRPGRADEDISVRIQKISQILNANFSDTVEGQKYLVTYAYYDGSSGTLDIVLKFNGTDYEAAISSYELESSDYNLIVTQLGATYPDATGSMNQFGNFERRPTRSAYWSDNMVAEALDIVLRNTYPSAEEGALYEVTFAIYDGSPGTETFIMRLEGGTYIRLNEVEDEIVLKDETKLFALASNWVEPYTFEEEDYTTMQQNFPNFSDEQEALRNIAIFLGAEFPFAAEGDRLPVAYAFFVRGQGTGDVYSSFVHNGDKWIGTPKVIETSLQFGLEEGTWVPDNTIVYALAASDYDYIVTEFTGVSGYEAQVGNLDNFGNFNRNGGSTNWDDDQILAAINAVLLNNNPTVEVGQKFTVSYAIYNGSNGTEQLKVILDETGVYVLNN